MESLCENPKKTAKRARRLVRRQWYSDLKLLLASLEETPLKVVLDNDDLSQLKIRVSDLPLEVEEPLDFGPRFFAPFAREELQTSACVLSDPDNTEHRWQPPPEIAFETFYYDRGLAFEINKHVNSSRLKYGFPWGWRGADLDTRYYRGAKYAGGYLGGKCEENCWMVDYISDKLSGTPHLMLVMTSDHTGNDGLLRSEMVAMVSFMLARFRSKSRRKHVVHPILIVSVLRVHQIRILQGHFDGHLNIRCSNIIDSSSPDHERAMNLVVRWLMSKPCGETTIDSLLPDISGDAVDSFKDDRNDQQPQTTLAIRASA